MRTLSLRPNAHFHRFQDEELSFDNSNANALTEESLQGLRARWLEDGVLAEGFKKCTGDIWRRRQEKWADKTVRGPGVVLATTCPCQPSS